MPFQLDQLDDPLRHWRKDKFKVALETQRIYCSNSNKKVVVFKT
jgi:hypothetical protein